MITEKIYDIAIIGLGPAGATFANHINKKYKIIAIDRKNEKFSKCCGGLLSHGGQKSISKLDLTLTKNILVDPQIFSVRTIDIDNNLERYYQRLYINMDRQKFDEFLITLIGSNIELKENSFCTQITKDGNYYLVNYEKDGEKNKFKCKVIIGADGANGIVRNTFYGNKKITKYVSIQEWYKNEMPAFYSCIFDKSITDSYCWTITKNDNFIIGGAFPVKDCEAKFEILKEKARSRGMKFNERLKREGCFVYFNKWLTGITTGKNGIYLVGEAAGMISPSTLEGISSAIDSGKILAEIINKNGINNKVGRKYFYKSFNIRLRLIIKNLRMPFMYNKFLRKIIMKTGIFSIK